MRLKIGGGYKRFLPLIIFLAVIFNIGLSQAGTSCADGQIILRLSSATNAHGEVWNGAGNYPIEICYDKIFGTAGNGDRTCTGSNKVVGLSSQTNAHAEGPSQTNYPINVCYSGLSCTARTSGCQTGEFLVVSLSSNTNAHLASDASYPVAICCSTLVLNNPKGTHDTSTCTSSTGWTCDADNYNQALRVDFYANGPAGTGTFIGNTIANIAREQAVADQCGGNSNHGFVFNTPESLKDGINHLIYAYGINIGSGNNTLLSSSPRTINCVPPTPPCELNSAEWSVTETVEGRVVDLEVDTINCQDQILSFEVKEKDAVGDDNVITNPESVTIITDGITSTSWIAEWQCDGEVFGVCTDDPPEYRFTATISNVGSKESNELIVYRITPDTCELEVINTCSDYENQDDCENDICVIANVSVPSYVNCSDPSTDCSCSWNTTTMSCKSSWTNSSIGSDIGTCYYTENTTDTCEDDGYLTVDLIATWVWDSECNASCQTENQGIAASCQSTTEVFQCPAQIPLPLFGFYNLLAALVLIAVIYWAISLRKKGKK